MYSLSYSRLLIITVDDFHLIQSSAIIGPQFSPIFSLSSGKGV
jgi:hypothetical protein